MYLPEHLVFVQYRHSSENEWREPCKFREDQREYILSMVAKGYEFRKCVNGDIWQPPYRKGFKTFLDGKWVSDPVLAKEYEQDRQDMIDRFNADPDNFIMGG